MTTRGRVGEVFETDVIDLAYDGKSVGQLDGKIVFLDGGLPGEKVRARIVRSKPRYSIARVTDIVTRSADRIKAPCVHFDSCGGCTWQDLEYGRQLYYKRKQVVDTLKHVGKFDSIEVSGTVGSKDEFYYRNKMEFSFNAGANGGFSLGLHRRGAFNDVLDVRECLLESRTSNEILDWFRGFIRENELSVYDVTSHTGFLRFLVIRQARRTGQIMLNIVTMSGSISNVENLINSGVTQFPEIATIVRNVSDQRANIARGEKEDILFGNGYIEERLFDYTFRIYSNSFFQTNTAQAEVLYGKAFDLLELGKGDYLLDLYCGTGAVGICASGYVNEVTGIDSESSAIQAARENAEINGVTNIRFIRGLVREIMRDRPDIFERLTCAIIDPPRAGMHPKALKRLIELNLPRIVYISCNPATFARDASILTDSGYKMSNVVPVDMFPHTMHIEVVAGFCKANL